MTHEPDSLILLLKKRKFLSTMIPNKNRLLNLIVQRRSYLWFYVLIASVCLSNIVIPIVMPQAVGFVKYLNEFTGVNYSKIRNFDSEEHISILSWGEYIPEGNGLGWDGKAYARVCKDFPSILFDEEYRSPRKIRFVPSAFAYLIIKTLSLSFEAKDVVLGFRILDSVMLLLSVYFFLLICKEVGLTERGTWLAFVGLFVNYLVLKAAMYLPVSTNCTAFLLGLMAFYFYLKDSKLGLLLTTLIGLFTWPTFMYVGLLLFVFPNQKIEVCSTGNDFLVCCMSVLASLSYFACYMVFVIVSGVDSYFGGSSIIQSVIPLSLCIVLTYIFVGTKIFLTSYNLLDYKALRANCRLVRLISFVALALCYSAFVKYGLNSQQPPFLWTIKFWTPRAIIQPFVFYISHVIYWGPILLFTLFVWKRIVDLSKNFGLGLFLVLVFSYFLALNSESRHLINVIPVVVILTAKALETYPFNRQECWVFGIISVLYSKIWMLINTTKSMPSNFLEFPWQKYFMNFGPWMSNEMYIVHGIAVALTGIWLYRKIATGSFWS